jgi:hypothetical protein
VLYTLMHKTFEDLQSKTASSSQQLVGPQPAATTLSPLPVHRPNARDSLRRFHTVCHHRETSRASSTHTADHRRHLVSRGPTGASAVVVFQFPRPALLLYCAGVLASVPCVFALFATSGNLVGQVRDTPPVACLLSRKGAGPELATNR